MKISCSKKRVVDQIKERVSKELPVNAQAVQQENPSLYAAARRYIGTWDCALKEAGLDPKEHKRKRNNVLPHGYWTADKIHMHFQDFLGKTTDLSPNNAQKVDPKLYAIVVNKFGSWEKYLTARGYNYKEIRKTNRWSKEKIIKKIQEAKVSFADLSDSTVNFYESGLYSAACNYFESWGNAIEAAGLKYDDIGRYRRWTKEKTIEKAKEVIEVGLNLSKYLQYDSGMRGAVQANFPSHNDFYAAVGLDTKSLQDEISNQIEELRKGKKWSRQKLADMVGLSSTTIYEFEKNQKIPTIAQAIRIAKALDSTVEYIFCSVGREDC